MPYFGKYNGRVEPKRYRIGKYVSRQRAQRDLPGTLPDVMPAWDGIAMGNVYCETVEGRGTNAAELVA